jgi:hypothetical protein
MLAGTGRIGVTSKGLRGVRPLRHKQARKQHSDFPNEWLPLLWAGKAAAPTASSLRV